MKVSNYDLLPSRKLRFRRLSSSDQTGRLALEHSSTAEAVAITADSIKFNPLPIELGSWEELRRLAPPYDQPHKPGSTFHWMYGDNPHLIVTVGGGMFPVPDRPTESLSIKEAVEIRHKAEQAAIMGRAKLATEKTGWATSTVAEVIFAGIAATMAVIVVVAFLPRLLERF